MKHDSANNFPCLNSEILIARIPHIADTSYLDYFNFERQTQILDINVNEDELLVSNITLLNLPQGNLTQRVELISIENWSFTPDFLQICNYIINE